MRYWRSGAVAEDSNACGDCFTPDVVYVEHVLGTMHGRALGTWSRVDAGWTVVRAASRGAVAPSRAAAAGAV